MSARTWSAPGWAALAVVGAFALAAPDAAASVRWVPLLVGAVVFVLPHGAVDHHVPRRLSLRVGPAFVAWYLAAVAVGLALWALAPLATLAAFLLVAAVHWGSGDGWYARAVHRRPAFTHRVDMALFIAARGALPTALPALAHPVDLARGADAILAAVGAGPAPTLAAPVRTAGLAAVMLLVAAAGVTAVRAARGRTWAGLVDVGELALLASFFTLTPAILAVGTYLLVWHAPRHIARLIASDPVQSALPPSRALAVWTREAAPLTVASLAGLALLAATAWRVPAATDAVAGAGLALIAALTFPHAAVVGWMDYRQAVFSWPSAGRPAPRARGGGPPPPEGGPASRRSR